MSESRVLRLVESTAVTSGLGSASVAYLIFEARPLLPLGFPAKSWTFHRCDIEHCRPLQVVRITLVQVYKTVHCDWYETTSNTNMNLELVRGLEL